MVNDYVSEVLWEKMVLVYQKEKRDFHIQAKEVFVAKMDFIKVVNDDDEVDKVKDNGKDHVKIQENVVVGY